MDINQNKMSDLGLEYVKLPITNVRIHRTDGQWLVEYKKLPRWYALWNWFWWWNDGKYVSYNDAVARAQKLSSNGYVLSTRYKRAEFYVTREDD